LPKVIDRQLTITSPITTGPVTLSGGGTVQVMQVASGAKLNLMRLTISDGVTSSVYGGGIDNEGTLTLYNTALTGNSANDGYGDAGYGGSFTMAAR
jgi:hypothetical protein